MRIGKVLAGLTLAAAGAYAQTAAPIELAAVPGAGAGGRPAVVVANTGSTTVTAFAYSSWGITKGASLKSAPISMLDAAWEPFLSPILPGQRVTMPFNLPQDPAKPAPAVVAVIFADGSSWGDRSCVERMVQHRKYLLQRLTESLQDLQQAKAQGTDRETLVLELQSNLSGARAAAADAIDRVCVSMARQTVLKNMSGATGSYPAILQSQIDALSVRLVKLRSYGNLQ